VPHLNVGALSGITENQVDDSYISSCDADMVANEGQISGYPNTKRIEKPNRLHYVQQMPIQNLIPRNLSMGHEG
jgi:hypothetical protein